MSDPLCILKALADETRLRLAVLLAEYELNVGELKDILDMGQSRVSRHLKILSECGLLSNRRDGHRIYYRAARQGLAAALLTDLRPHVAAGPEFEADARLAQAAIEYRQQATQRFFDHIAGDWERLRREVLGDFDPGRALADQLPPVEVAVDLGCGDGEMAPALLTKARRVIGVDNSARMLERAQEKLSSLDGRLDLRIGSLEHLPLADGEAQAAVFSLSLHHLPQPAAGLKEAARVLGPGGWLLILELCKHGDETMRRRYGDHWLGFGSDELLAWLEEAGLTLTRRQEYPLPGDLNLQLITAAKSAAKRTAEVI